MKDKNSIILTIENLVTGYKKKKLITADFSQNVKQGTITAIIGLNGSGKTTLLKTAAGILKPVSGSVTYSAAYNACAHGDNAVYPSDNDNNNNRFPINSLSPEKLAEIRSLILSKPPEAGMLTVFDIVSLPHFINISYRSKLSEKSCQNIEKALILTGIKKLSDRFFKTLSDGEKQKTMIARAIAQNTPLMFMDEPAAFLDLPSRIDFSALLKQLVTQENKTVIITTHDLQFAINSCDFIWVIDKYGKIKSGNPAELLKTGSIENAFEITKEQLSKYFIQEAYNN